MLRAIHAPKAPLQVWIGLVNDTPAREFIGVVSEILLLKVHTNVWIGLLTDFIALKARSCHHRPISSNPELAMATLELFLALQN